ncbi:class I SAM-dependent methyltransferase [Methylomonas rosea]|uniref:Class I SAM-dependent methyltransferase n=1 Tax=Methylomonas rosea TaxID=2952227 RepID=A0ABT1TR91_9GAMM|nr:class I SAM-dependent methyltransferase [Methylomonas sp. WSC-7]MCQ8117282.1 class I SAM-dependent methyltransferase [Methylomonas sp. WSC-7]
MIILKSYYSTQMYMPGWLGIFVNPFYFARLGLYQAIKELSSKLGGEILDVGCGTKPYKQLFNFSAYTGLDIDSTCSRSRGIADYLYDGKRFPFDDASFDAVLCNQVFEHVFNPDEFLEQINRVLKPNGRLLLTVPFVWDEHEQPYDFARYSSFGLRALLETHGFKIIEHRKTCADVSVLFQLMNAFIFKIIQPLSKICRLLLTVTVMALINLSGIFVSRLLPANPDLFLDNIVLAEKIREDI